jgi:hypothetical protein
LDPGAIIFSILQNLCRCLSLLLVWFKVRHWPTTGPASALLGTIFISRVIGLLTNPNTYTEICETEASASSVWRTTIVVYVYIAALLVLYVVQMKTPSPILSGDPEVGLIDSQARSVPNSTANMLAVSLALRLFMEAMLGTSLAITGSSLGSKPAFKEMLILEHVLEHSQAPLLLAAVFSSAEFQPVTKTVQACAVALRRALRGARVRRGEFGHVDETVDPMTKATASSATTKAISQTSSTVDGNGGWLESRQENVAAQ